MGTQRTIGLTRSRLLFLFFLDEHRISITHKVLEGNAVDKKDSLMQLKN